MKQLFTLFLFLPVAAFSQQPLFLPDTLHGPTYSLNLRHDSVLFIPGSHTKTIGINNQKYLGPVLFLNKGENISITVHNQLNELTTVHWHGLHVAPVNDGGPHTTIASGATWNPQFTVMDHASTYWYHAHAHMMTGKHVMSGLAGMIIVKDSTEAALNLPRTYGVDDYPVIIQTQELDTLNQIVHDMMGDSLVLINGTINPYLNVPGQIVRLRLLNASKERAYNVGFSNNMNFSVIANDGGLLSAPVSLNRLLLAPGERAEVLVNFTSMNGQSVNLLSYGSQIPNGIQGSGSFNGSPLDGTDFVLLALNIGTTTANPVTTIPATLVQHNPWTPSQANLTRTITFSSQGMMNPTGPFFFNGLSFDMNRIDYSIPLNNTEIWQLTNMTMVAHPFHIHDIQFYILNRDGNPPSPVESGRKDVVLVQPMETVEFITKFEDFADTVLPYMYHCHILMHEDDGMMGQFIVTPEKTGINENRISDFVVYPNPAADKIFIRGDYTGPVEIFDPTGRRVVSGFITKEDKSLSLQGLSNGIYFLGLSDGKGINPGIEKFVISR